MSYSREVGFLADRSGEAQQSIPSGTPTTFEGTQNPFDVGGFYNVSTFEWTPAPGTYLIHAHIKILSLDTNDEFEVRVLKDGAMLYFDNKFATTNNQDTSAGAVGATVADGSNVYRVQVEHNQGGALNISSLAAESYFYALRIGRLP